MLDLTHNSSANWLNGEPLLLGGSYYTVCERLNASGQAVLYLCEDTEGNEFVLKLFYENIDYSDEKASRYYLLPRHPHILPLLSYGVVDGRHYELTPYMKNGSLEGKLLTSAELGGAFINDMEKALRYLHGAGIVHRDVKPSNIYISDDRSNYLIGDFGAISLMGDAPYVHTESGNRTLAFCAPEMLEKKKYVSPESDYYSLGLTILTLMRGESPFRDMDNEDIAFRIKNDKIPGIDYKKFFQKSIDTRLLSDRLEGLVLGLCRTLPRDRWGSYEISQWLDGTLHYPIISIKSADNDDYADPFDLLGVKYYNAQTLAPALAENWEFSKKLLKDSIISDFYRSKSQTLTAQLNGVWEENKSSLDVALFKTIYTICPSLDILWWKGRSYHSLRQMTSEIRSNNSDINMDFSSFLASGCISFLVENAECLQSAEVDIQKIRDIEKDERNRKGFGLSKLCYYCRIEGTSPTYYYNRAEILNPDMYFDQLFIKRRNIAGVLSDMTSVNFASWMWSLGFADKYDAYIESSSKVEGHLMKLRVALEFMENIVDGKYAVRQFAMNHGMYSHIVHLRNNLNQYVCNSTEAIEVSSALQLPMISEILSVREIFAALYKLSGTYNQFVRLTSKNPFTVAFGAGSETADIIPKNSDGYFMHEKDGFFCSTAYLKSQGLVPEHQHAENTIKKLASETKTWLNETSDLISHTNNHAQGGSGYIPSSVGGGIAGIVLSAIFFVLIILGVFWGVKWFSPFYVVLAAIAAALFPFFSITNILHKLTLDGVIKSSEDSGETVLLNELKTRIALIDSSILPLIQNITDATAVAIPTAPDTFFVNDYLGKISKSKKKQNKKDSSNTLLITSYISCFAMVILEIFAMVGDANGFPMIGSGIVPIIIGIIISAIIVSRFAQKEGSLAHHYICTICCMIASFFSCAVVEAFIQVLFGKV